MVQETMERRGMLAKDRIEGPCRRECSILLRQTSFKEIQERIVFPDGNGGLIQGHHTARFGEVEQ